MAVAVAALVGVALTPTLATTHPLALLVLDARNRTLVLVAKHIDLTPFVVVAVLRRLASDPLYYILGRRYGERAVGWIERRAGRGGVLRLTEVVFRRAAYPMVFLFPGALVCALAGQTGMHPLAFAALNVGGTAAVVVVLRVFGTTVLADPVEAVLRFFRHHRVVTTMASVALVLVWVVVQKITGRAETPSIEELEDELLGEDRSEAEEGVEADGDPGMGRDRLDREEDSGQER